MLNLHDLSFRYKIPLRSTVLVLITAVPLSISIMLQEYGELGRDQILEKTELSRIMVENLIAPMRQDDVWHAYQTVESLLSRGPRSAIKDGPDDMARITEGPATRPWGPDGSGLGGKK